MTNEYTGGPIVNSNIQLTTQQQTRLQSLYDNARSTDGNYSAAYHYLHAIRVNTEGYNSQVAFWFYNATKINRNDGSFISEWARNMIINAGKLEGIDITRNSFKLNQTIWLKQL